MTEKFFAAANSSGGFVCWFDEIFSPESLDRCFIIKGGSGTGKSTFMKRVAAEAEKRGWHAEYFFCSSDPSSLDGVILHGGGGEHRRVALLDGTAPHSHDPKLPGAVEEIVNLGECWDVGPLAERRGEISALTAEKSKKFAESYEYLWTAGEISKLLRGEAAGFVLADKMRAAVDRLLTRLASEAKREKSDHSASETPETDISGSEVFSREKKPDAGSAPHGKKTHVGNPDREKTQAAKSSASDRKKAHDTAKPSSSDRKNAHTVSEREKSFAAESGVLTSEKTPDARAKDGLLRGRRHSCLKGKVITRPVSAISTLGEVSFDTYLSLGERRFIAFDSLGTLSFLFDELIRRAVEMGFDVVRAPSPLLPDESEAIFIPALGVSVVSAELIDRADGEGFARQIYYSDAGARMLNMTRFVNIDAVSRDDRRRRRALTKCVRELQDGALARLSEVRRLHAGVESVYISAMDFGKVDRIREEVERKIFG